MILVKGGTIIDGAGGAEYRANLVIKGDYVASIGELTEKKLNCERIIDASGCLVIPGFIDVHNTSDHHLTIFTNPNQGDALLQGITTIIGGHCGASLAPLLYGSLESIRKYADINSINVNWHSVGEFYALLAKQKLGVNFGTFAGHTTIRRALIGNGSRDLTMGELQVFSQVLQDSMKDGAIGLSTGLGYAHANQTPYGEIKNLVAKIAETKGVYATHLRDERENIISAVKEAVRIAEETGVEVIISHLKPIETGLGEYSTALEAILKSPASSKIHFTSYPYDVSLHPIYTLLPAWAKTGTLETMIDHLKNPHHQERIIRELESRNIAGLNITVMSSPGYEHFAGKTLAAIAENRGISHEEALLELMSATRLRALVSLKDINLDWIIQGFRLKNNLVASIAPSFPENYSGVKHPRSQNTFPRFLAMMQATKMISRGEAVRKITGDPAKKLNFKKRGLIKEGYFADLVVMQNEKVRDVLVNGSPAVLDGALTGTRVGAIIRSEA